MPNLRITDHERTYNTISTLSNLRNFLKTRCKPAGKWIAEVMLRIHSATGSNHNAGRLTERQVDCECFEVCYNGSVQIAVAPLSDICLAWVVRLHMIPKRRGSILNRKTTAGLAFQASKRRKPGKVLSFPCELPHPVGGRK